MSLRLAEELGWYEGVLAPIFSPKGVNTFEYACALLRVGGMEDAGWDPLQESIELFQDLITLSESLSQLPETQFTDPEKTGLRLALISYAHLTEMDAPYHLL